MSPERLLQQDMFTGDLIDNRTRAKKSQDRRKELPHQEFLFSQRELAEPSRQHHFEPPSNTPLLLQSEDPRTDEERERDQQRAIEAAMDPLFGTVPVDEDACEEGVETVDRDEDTELDDEDEPEGPDPAELRREVYLELVRLSEEQAESLWIAPPYDAAYLTQIGVLAAQARSLGISEYEISLAVRIGQFRGAKRKDEHHRLTG